MTGRKILVVGNGGREHALAWQLTRSPNVTDVFCCPGNGGTATLKGCQNLEIKVDDFVGITQAVRDNQIDLVVVGPEMPLSLGITDYLTQENIPVFGPDKAGAQIEASKSWAKEIMVAAGVPTAKSKTFTEANAAKDYIRQEGTPIVIKADALAAGKGVIVATTLTEALSAVDSLFRQDFTTLVVEEFLIGEEVSILALTDGKTIIPLLPAQDHKRIGEGDTGNNTGGMGAYAPAPLCTPEILQLVETNVLQRTIVELRHRGIDYRGILYAGLMISPEGEVKVLEFNCRFGDPETQAVMALLVTPLDELLIACVEGKLESQQPLKWQEGSAVCVVVAAGGYPEAYKKGKTIAGIELAEESGAVVFQAGTKLVDDKILSDGGRVLGVTATGANFDEAIERVYPAVSKISFEGMYYRRDIGHRVRVEEEYIRQNQRLDSARR
jgi:phosphoribosylamine---glycine ligase